MKDLGITKSIVSITSPGTNIVPGDRHVAATLSRECNQYAADLKRRVPESFGYWASLPLPFVDKSLAEISYALDNLNPDGFGLLSNYHGVYLGDSSLDPVFAELDRRRAKVFIHPTGPCVSATCEQGPVRASPLKQFPDPMFEYLLDTTRCVINLFLSGTVARYPNITYILSHAGGALPPVIQRFTTFSEAILKLQNGINAASVKKTLQERFFFDLAGFPFPDQIHGLLRYVDSSRLLYGSDFPYTPASGVAFLATMLEKEGPVVFTQEGELEAVESRNAEKLLLT
jgi:predicted TIM-barrel fold metal-dependent hydrolase